MGIDKWGQFMHKIAMRSIPEIAIFVFVYKIFWGKDMLGFSIRTNLKERIKKKTKEDAY